MPDISKNQLDLPFLPARKSVVFSKLFEWYCNWLFWRRFDSVEVHCNYNTGPGKNTIFYLNHNSWWDGLIPFYLNQKIFHQDAYGMMEDKQLHRYPFFRRLGVFSIDLSSTRSSMQSIRYAIEIMQNPDTSLYIYPQGKITSFSTNKLEFEKGIGWLAKKLPDADLVPIAIYIHTKQSDKPRLEIVAGNAVETDRSLPADTINNVLNNKLSDLLKQLTS